MDPRTTPEGRAFLMATSAAMCTYAGNAVDALPLRVRAVLLQHEEEEKGCEGGEEQMKDGGNERRRAEKEAMAVAAATTADGILTASTAPPFDLTSSTALRQFSNGKTGAADGDARASPLPKSLFPSSSSVCVDALTASALHDGGYYGRPIKPLFTIKSANHSINFGSFGVSPCYVMAAKHLWTAHQEGDSDAWVRLQGPAEHGRVRAAVAAYMNTPVPNDGFPREVVVVDGATANGAIVSAGWIDYDDGAEEQKEERGTEGAVVVGAAAAGAGAEEGQRDSPFLARGHVHPDEVFLVDNLADATNIVAKSYLANFDFPLKGRAAKGESASAAAARTVLYFANQYPMLKAAVGYYGELACGAGNVHWRTAAEDEGAERATGGGSSATAPSTQRTMRIVEIPMTAAMIADCTLFATTVAKAVERHGADALIMDHYCWAPTFVLPVVAVCRAVRAVAPECFIVIDGAHSIGQLSLAHLFPANTSCIGGANQQRRPLFDVYMTNCHKWLTTPRSAAVLWVPARHHQYLHPNTISNQYRGFATETVGQSASIPSSDKLLDRQHSTRTQAEFYWCGTRDMSNWLVVRDAIRYRAEALGGEGAIMRYNKWLANEGAAVLAHMWGTRTLREEIFEQFSSSSQKCAPAGCLVCVRAPTDDAATNVAVCRIILQHCDSFAAPVTFALGGGGSDGRCGEARQYIRVSAQIYNCMDDYRYFGERYLSVLAQLQASL